jgi:cytidylate kinase
MAKALTIAIDGPAASGKSTLAKSLSEALGYLYFDTGVLYRAVTLAALQQDVDLANGDELAALASDLTIEVLTASEEDGRLYDVMIGEEDSTWAIRMPEVDANVSQVSAFAGVRNALRNQQRRIGLKGGVVMAGRDIGTVVLPEADVKLFLDASVEERARRRYAEMIAHGDEAVLAEVEDSMRHRDEIDASRDVAPLRAAADAVVLSSEGKNPEDVLRAAMQIVGKGQDTMEAES